MNEKSVLFGIFSLAVVAAMIGCKDADVAQFESMGARHKITCYSGTQVIYQGESTGNVNNEHGSDGWYWEDATTHKLVEASGACLFEQE